MELRVMFYLLDEYTNGIIMCYLDISSNLSHHNFFIRLLKSKLKGMKFKISLILLVGMVMCQIRGSSNSKDTHL